MTKQETSNPTPCPQQPSYLLRAGVPLTDAQKRAFEALGKLENKGVCTQRTESQRSIIEVTNVEFK